MFLDKIPADDWCEYIKSRFESKNKHISEEFARRICETVDCYSTYVQELAWTIFVESDDEVTDESFREGLNTMLQQNSAYFQSRIAGLTTYQMNFIRAICDGVHSDFGGSKVIGKYNLGTKSNISRLMKALEDREIIDTSNGTTVLSDPVLEIWFRKEFM